MLTLINRQHKTNSRDSKDEEIEELSKKIVHLETHLKKETTLARTVQTQTDIECPEL